MSAAAWESLHKAALELAKSAGLKQRLTEAYGRHLHALAPQEMPGELREDFEALRLAMTRVRPLQGESAVAATVRKMSMGEADHCAARIMAMLDLLHRSGAAPARANGQPSRHGGTGVESPTVRVPTLISVNRA